MFLSELIVCNQVVIDLGAAPLDGEADWYTLTSHEESLQILVSTHLYGDCLATSDQTHSVLMKTLHVQRRAGMQMSESATSPVGSVDHLSPPSTSSRLSDSEPDPSDLGEVEDGVHMPHSSRHGRVMDRGMDRGGSERGLERDRGQERSVRSDGASVSSMGSSSR